jgi:UDP-N-acetylmuramyl pentapeptide phosphotransferase/UDP-N-acetylglucosamine-1-phosphate transferase
VYGVSRLSVSAVLAPALAFGLSVALIRLLLTRAVRGWFLDHPNQRSLHAAPTPRVGGLGLMPAALAAMAISGRAPLAAGLALALMIVSVVDDWKDLSPALRLPLHLVAAAAFVWLTIPQGAVLVLVVLALAVGWMTNLYNFMDGSDGLAGGMALIGFGTYALAAAIAGDSGFAQVNFCVAAAAAGFLVFNFPPARVFMGDAGSIPLGFLAAALGLQGWSEGLWPLWFPLVVFAPFVLDASVTLARRLLRGERVWQAHRSHYYQRLILLGWSHRRTAAAEYALMAASGAVAVAAVFIAPRLQVSLLVGLAGVYVAAALAIDLRWRRRVPA